ncbi:UNVERIFIED_CONTAM: hypothetical protein Sradi_3185300 [Sesamum radiatum]|uniref:Uncharacterized protein n=1 Tax=Sesamum radiatum TaxID=300843 RepID=A0AAW2RH72_SESRA
MASSDESIFFVKEIFSDDDLSEATSRRTEPGSSGLLSGWRWSMRQAAMATCCFS